MPEYVKCAREQKVGCYYGYSKYFKKVQNKIYKDKAYINNDSLIKHDYNAYMVYE